MSLIDEYARNKEIRAENRLIGNMLRAGYSPRELADVLEIPLSRVLDIEKSLESEK